MIELNEDAYEITKSRYFWENETKWEHLVERISKENIKNEKEENKEKFYKEFKETIGDMLFIPGGRILRNLGKLRPSTSNCNFLPIEDNIESIFETLKHYGIIAAHGGGCGINFSLLRPMDAPMVTRGGESSGVLSFIDMFNYCGAKLVTGGQRRAAGIALMSVSHPDIIDFINAKKESNRLNQFNISVVVNDIFLKAVEANIDWELKFAGKVYNTINARKLWDMILNNMLENAEPGLINWDNLRKNNSYFFSPIHGTNPCGELPLSDYECCNLGSLVLSKFISNTNTNWQKLAKAIQVSIRFLDNIVDLAYYPIQQQEIVVKNARRLGLGTMGLADYLFLKEIRYGSERSLYEIEKLYKFIRNEAYLASIELAKEKGAFPKYDRIEYCSASFVRKLPASIRMLIREHAIRNVTTTTAAPTGCLVDGTLVSSEIGTKPIEDYEKINLRSARGRNFTKSDFEDVHIKKYYDRGFAKTKNIKTRHGFEIQGTLNHKLRVLTSGNGYSWRSINDIKEGDIVVLKKGFLYNKKQTWLSDDKAELLGYYMADGWWTVSGRSHRLYFETSNSNESEYISNLIYKSFGNTFKIKVYKRDRDNSKSIRLEINNKELYNWFQKFKCIKNKAINAFIPDIVLSGSLNNIISFVKGYHMGDGHTRSKDNRIGFTTISKIIANQLHTILLGLGFISHLNSSKENNNIIINNRKINSFNIVYRICVNRYDSYKLIKLLYNTNIPIPKNGNKELVILTPNELSKFNDKHISHTKNILLSNDDIICATIENYNSKIKNNNKNWFIKNNLCFDVVKKTEINNNTHVNDLEIHENSHTYIANGFVTHNTTSLIAGVVGGIEPLPYKGYDRVDGVGNRCYIHSLCKDNYDADWFVDSSDLKPEDHLEVQTIIQKYIDGGVSKTILLPENTSVKTLNKLLLEYIHDLKGVTVYRNNSRDKQVYYPLTKKEINEKIKKGGVFNSLGEDDVQCKSGVCDI